MSSYVSGLCGSGASELSKTLELLVLELLTLELLVLELLTLELLEDNEELELRELFILLETPELFSEEEL